MDLEKKDSKDELEIKNEGLSEKLFDRIPDDVLSEFSEELSEPTMGLIQRIIGVFTSPKAVMEDVKIKPYTGMLLLVFALVGLITTIPTLSLIKDSILDAMLLQSGEINIDSAMLDSILNYTVIATLIGAVVSSALVPIVSGLVSHIIAILVGGEGKFKQTIGINTMAYTVIMAGTILRLALILVTKNIYVSFSPAMFLGANPTANPLYSLLSVVEVFNIIYLYFVYIGIKVVHNVSSFKAWIITLLPTIFLILISLIPVILSR